MSIAFKVRLHLVPLDEAVKGQGTVLFSTISSWFLQPNVPSSRLALAPKQTQSIEGGQEESPREVSMMVAYQFIHGVDP
jgi:hypothetical protein